MIRLIKACLFFVLILGLALPAFALEPEQILIVANSDIEQSLEIARYYCSKRNVPPENILSLPLGTSLGQTITRDGYEKQLAEPIREKLMSLEFAGKKDSQTLFFALGNPIKCLLTTYGVPVRIAGRGVLKGRKAKLIELEKLTGQARKELKQLQRADVAGSEKRIKQIKQRLNRLQLQIGYIKGKDTGASVDSELSMVLFGDYKLYRWQPNGLKNKVDGLSYRDFKTLMVSRLDGPDFRIARDLVDKALIAEKTGLRGIAYIDSRGIADNKNPSSFGYFDQSLRDLAVLTRLRTEMPVKQEQTEKLFGRGACPRTAIYCGWYSLEKYIDAFDFVNGAIGYHISSLEAVNLRDSNSSQWCPAMLKDGITATLGAVAEPYLHSFPQPRAFFAELFNGRCLVEAYYRTKPFNSWQLVLIGDPLYRPFKKP